MSVDILMNNSEISITRNELNKIQKILDQFPKITNFKIKESYNSGIGSNLFLELDTNVHNTNGKFIVEISGTENW